MKWQLTKINQGYMREITEEYDLAEEASWTNKLWDTLFKANRESQEYRHNHPQEKSLDRHAKKVYNRRSSDRAWPELKTWFSPDEYLVRKEWLVRLDK